MYEAENGALFRTEAECMEHERRCAAVEVATEMISRGAPLSEVLVHAGVLAPDDARVKKLEGITKDTRLIIPHWQCSERRGYGPVRVGLDGRIYLHGDAGAWSGPYGAWIGLAELIRYVDQQTAYERG
jgi:hypothetical protein